MGIGDPETDAKYFEYPEPTVVVSDIESLDYAMSKAVSGQIIGITGGDYYVFAEKSNRRLQFYNKQNVILRSVSGNYDDVTLYGTGFHKIKDYHKTPTDEMLIVGGGSSDVTFYGITIRDVNCNGYKVDGTNERNVTIDNCRAIDVNERMVKGSAGGGDSYVYNLVIKNSWFENTQIPRTGADEDHSTDPGNYIGGIDVMNIIGCLVQNCTFVNIQGAEETGSNGRGGVFIWGQNGCKDITVENNLFINCDRGITYYLGDSTQSGRWGIEGGIIRNNIIYGVVWDAIQICYSKDIGVYNNTIIMTAKRNRGDRGVRDPYSNCENLIIKNNIAHQFQLGNNNSDIIILLEYRPKL
jgi:hypothetical protein